MKYFIFASLLSFNIFAAEELVCDDDIVPVNLEELARVKEKLEWHSASGAQIRNAPCLRTSPFTDKEMKEWMVQKDSSKKISKNIHGISFESESPENIKAFEHLTTATDFFGKPDKERQKKFKSSCKKVQCAMDEIFGKATGTQLLFMQRKFGMNGSHLAYKNSSPWKKSELNEILLGLSDFPEGILPMEESRTLVHFSRGYMRFGGEGTIANAVIEIFDVWNEMSPESRRSTITHELGHALAAVSKTNISESPEWLKMGNWEKKTKIVDGVKLTDFQSKNPKTVSRYGLTNPREDFAEAVTAYRYNPQFLKKTSPEKYNLIKTTLFDNVEYTSVEACKNPKRLSASVVEKSKQQAEKWTPSQAEIEEIAKTCSPLAYGRLANMEIDLRKSHFTECYEEAIKKGIVTSYKESLKNQPYSNYLDVIFRNVEAPQISSGKLATMVVQARNTHRTLLRNEVAKGFKDNYFFDAKCDKSRLETAWLRTSDSIGINPRQFKNEIHSMTYRSCLQMSTQSSLRRFLKLGYSDEEIRVQVEKMIP